MKNLITNIGLFLFLQFLFVLPITAQKAITPETALKSYLDNGDTHYSYELKDTFSIGKVRGYDILLTSQKWRQYVWKHQLIILIPDNTTYDGALLFIDGGHNNEETRMPEWKDAGKDFLIRSLAGMAEKNKAIITNLREVPNEPLFGGLEEDEIISYTFHQFIEDGDYSWPLLFPMVKSAHRAMDAIQDFTTRKGIQVNRFMVSGASKRGWTTWLTGASDPRVVAIAPMVIDILNMPVNLAHQMQAYGSYSVEIQDYVNLGIVEGMTSPGGNTLVNMVDPYSYRKKLTMPKLLMMGTNDPYWVIDNVKNYLPQIPGHNLLNYTPNAGHDLNKGIVAFPALSAFFGITMAKGVFPVCSWKTSKKGNQIRVAVKATQNLLVGASVWYANSTDMDFRNDEWKNRNLNVSSTSKVTVLENLPATAYHAFYVELKYKDPNGGTYSICTRAFMTDTERIL